VITNRSAVTATPISVHSHRSVTVGRPPEPRMILDTPSPAPLKVTPSISHFVTG
jgi:hypothetical protein